MALKILMFIVFLIMLDTAKLEYQKRLVLHSDQDINKVLYDIRQDITATKQENLALKTQMAQEIQALQNNMTQEKQALKAQMAQENQALKTQNDLTEEKIQALETNMTQEKQLVTKLTQDNQALKAKMEQDIQVLKTNFTQEKLSDMTQMAHENQLLRDQMTKDNLALKKDIMQLRNGQGSTYIRWGRTICEGNGTKKVYSGYSSGTNYGAEGGAANVICLPETPSWATYKDGIQGIGGYVYGTEYEVFESTFNPYGKRMDNEDAPCVLCHTTRAVTVMIPGSTTCYSGWTKEYTGYLMTEHHSYKSGTDYVCVDKSPEAVLHGEESKTAHAFYFTEVQCGALPCQDYPQGRELACVVCSI